MVKLDDPKVRAALEGGDQEEPLTRMSFGDHLDELRRRLVRALLALIVAVIGVMMFKHEVQEIVVEPYRVQWRIGFENWREHLEQQKLDGAISKRGQGFLDFIDENYLSIMDGTLEFKHMLPTETGYNVPYTLMAINGLEDIFNWMFASILFAVVLASPYVVWQAWAFIAAGLYAKERRLFYRYFPFMIGLFAAGVAFGYYLVLPFSLGFLINLMDPDQVGAMLSIGQYFALLFALTAALGLVFQLPLVMVALQRVGLVTHAAFRKHWRITVVIIAFSAAIFTPPEPVSMVLTMAPMCALYGLGLFMTSVGAKNEAKFATTGESDS